MLLSVAHGLLCAALLLATASVDVHGDVFLLLGNVYYTLATHIRMHCDARPAADDDQEVTSKVQGTPASAAIDCHKTGCNF